MENQIKITKQEPLNASNAQTPRENKTLLRRLSRAKYILLQLFMVILVLPKTLEACSIFATFIVMLCLAVKWLAPHSHPLHKYQRLLSASMLVFVGLNLLAFLLKTDIPNMGDANNKSAHIPGVMIALAFLLGVDKKYIARRLIHIFIFSALAYYSLELISLLWREPYITGRLIGSRIYHTVFAMELLLSLCFFLGFYVFNANKKWRIPTGLAAAVVLFLMLLTKTRSVLIVLLLASVPVIILLQKKIGTRKAKMWTVCLWLFVIAPTFAALWWSQATPARRNMANAKSRIIAWKISLDVTTSAPPVRVLLGHGKYSRTFSATAIHYRTASPIINNERLVHAHNIILQTMIEVGLLGLATFLFICSYSLWIIYLSFKKSSSRYDFIPRTLFLTIFTALAMGQLDYTLSWLSGHIFWMSCGFGGAYATLSRRGSTRH